MSRYKKENRSWEYSKDSLVIYTGYEALANAIIIFAAEDYRKARETLRMHPRNNNAKEMKKSCERFFRSPWCDSLTKISGREILKLLEAERRR